MPKRLIRRFLMIVPILWGKYVVRTRWVNQKITLFNLLAKNQKNNSIKTIRDLIIIKNIELCIKSPAPE